MAFPRQLLADHETIVLDLRPHWVAVLPSVFWTVAILAAMFLGYWAVGSVGAIGDTVGKSIVGAIALLAWVFLALLRVLRWRFTMFVLTTDRLITRQGVIAKSSKEIPLESINDVAFNQSVVERLLGAGDLLIESAGTRGQNLISNVRHPEQVQLAIFKEIESNTARTYRPDPAQPPAEDIPGQIEALARLKDQGAISEAEYESKKEELLKRL